MGSQSDIIIPAKMDIRGFLRIQESVIKALKLPKAPYADVYVDQVGMRIAFVPTKKLNENSFRIIPNPASILIYLKGAMKSIGMPVESGEYELAYEGEKIIFYGKKQQKKTGSWKIFTCRNSAGLPMLSIGTRGTLVLDKRTSELINTRENSTFTAEFDPKKKAFKLIFSRDEGEINVRTIASHANASFMGTLTSNGIALPEKRMRTTCEIKGNVIKFSAEGLFKQKKDKKKGDSK